MRDEGIRWWLAACALLATAGCAGASAGLRLFEAPSAFGLESMVLLNDAGRREKEVSYKLHARLHVLPLWAAPDRSQHFVEFRLLSPKLHLRGKHRLADFIPYDSVWDSYSKSTFFAHWNNGLVEEVHLDPTEPLDVLNFKKSVLSFFQFQPTEGERNETDFTGDCVVLYETIKPDVLRKIKRRCAGDAGGALDSAVRAARYSLGAEGELRQLTADELLAVGPAQLGLKARAWLRLERLAAPPSPGAPAARLDEARARVPPRLRPHTLLPEPQPRDDAADLDAASVEALLGGEEAGAGGDAEQARALLEALGPLARAPGPPLEALLRAQQAAGPTRLPALCALLGLAGSGAAHSAVARLLQLHGRDPSLEAARRYLAAFAHAHRPHEWAIREVLRIATEARAPPLVGEAFLAAAAAAHALASSLPAEGDPVSRAVRDALLTSLAACKDEECRVDRLRALGNLRRADTADALMEHATRAHAQPRAAVAALGALDALPLAALGFARLDALTDLALNESVGLEARAVALDAVARRRAALPAPLVRPLHALTARGPAELRRLLWARLATLAPRQPAVARLPAQLSPGAFSWWARAAPAASSVLRRPLGWGSSGWGASLDALQLLRGGLLRRASVRLLAEPLLPEDDSSLDLLTVEVWTRGLEAFGGGDEGAEAEAEAEAEEAGGGLALAVGGVRGPELALFSSRAELLGHVWAGTASAPTPVLRNARVAFWREARAHLAGGAALHASWRGAQALALDASAQVSLWWRTARADLELRGAAEARAEAQVRTAWGVLGAEASLRASPRLRIGADLDFQEGVRLCVRVRTAPLPLLRNVTLHSAQGARRLRVRRSVATATPLPGRSLSLGAPNDATCRTLRSADADAPDDADAY